MNALCRRRPRRAPVVLVARWRCSRSAVPWPRAGRADEDRSRLDQMLEAADDGDWAWARHLAARLGRAAAASAMCAGASCSRARTRRPSRPMPPFCARARTGRASARCRRAPRMRWIESSRSRSGSPSSRRAQPRTRQGRLLYAQALLAAGRSGEAAALCARAGSRTISAPTEERAVPRALRRRHLRRGPRGPARPPAVGRADRPGAAHVAAGRRRRAGRGHGTAQAAAVGDPGVEAGAGGVPAAARRDPGPAVRPAALAARARQRRRRARDPAEPAGGAAPAGDVVARAGQGDPRSDRERSFKLAYRLASASRQKSGRAASPRPNGSRAGWPCSSRGQPEAAPAPFRAAVAGGRDADQPGRAGYWAGRAAAAMGDVGRPPPTGTTVLRPIRTASTGSSRPSELGRDPATARCRRQPTPRGRARSAAPPRRRPRWRASSAAPASPATRSPSSAISATRRPTTPTQLAGGGRSGARLQSRRPRAGRDPRGGRQRRLSGPGSLSRCRASPRFARRTMTARPSRRWCWPWPDRRACSTPPRAAPPAPGPDAADARHRRRRCRASSASPSPSSRLTRDPDYNVRLGAFYLGQQLARFDDEPALALAAYNAGPGRVTAWLEPERRPARQRPLPADRLDRADPVRRDPQLCPARARGPRHVPHRPRSAAAAAGAARPSANPAAAPGQARLLSCTSRRSPAGLGRWRWSG